MFTPDQMIPVLYDVVRAASRGAEEHVRDVLQSVATSDIENALVLAGTCAMVIVRETPRECGHPECPLMPMLFKVHPDGSREQVDIDQAPPADVAFARMVAAVSIRDGFTARCLFEAYVGDDVDRAVELLEFALGWSAPLMAAAWERIVRRRQAGLN